MAHLLKRKGMKQFTLRLSEEQEKLFINYKGRVLSSTNTSYTNNELIWLLLRHGIYNLPPSEVGEGIKLGEKIRSIDGKD